MLFRRTGLCVNEGIKTFSMKGLRPSGSVSVYPGSTLQHLLGTINRLILLRLTFDHSSTQKVFDFSQPTYSSSNSLYWHLNTFSEFILFFTCSVVKKRTTLSLIHTLTSACLHATVLNSLLGVQASLPPNLYTVV